MGDRMGRNADSTLNRTDGGKTMPSPNLDKSQRSTSSEQNELGKKSTGTDQWQRNEKGNVAGKGLNK